MHQARRVTAALLAGSLALAACSSDDDAEAVPPIGGEDADDDSPTANPDDEDAAAVDDGDESDLDDEEPFAVPDEIDEDYAEQVVNALLELDLEALKIVLQQPPGEPIDAEALDRIHAISVGRRLDAVLERWQRHIDDPSTAEGFLPTDEMHTTEFHAESLLHKEGQACMVVGGWWDLSGTATEPESPDYKSLFSLSRLDRDVTDTDRNPTPWKIRQISSIVDQDGDPIPPELWSDVDFSSVIDSACGGAG